MELTLETLAAMACALAVAGVGWWLLGKLMCRLSGGGRFLLLLGRGNGAQLEPALRGALWLRSLGLLNAPILIADVDLDPVGRELALRLAARWPEVVLWPISDLDAYLIHYQ